MLARKFFQLVILGLCLVFAAAANSQESEQSDPIPEPRSEYKGRVIAQTMHYSGAEADSREPRERRTMLFATYQSGTQAWSGRMRHGCR